MMTFSFSTWRRTLAGFTLAVWMGAALHAEALVKIDTQSIDLAIRYGLQNKDFGYSSLLGPNWMEGPDGTLLNIYSPFMLLATRAAKITDLPENLSEADLKTARTALRKTIRDLTDPKIPLQVKFAVSLYGDNPDFAMNTTAHIEGFGRGKEFTLKPSREIRQKQPNHDPGAEAHAYEAVNSYYFNFKDVELLDEYRFVLEAPDREPVSFRIRTKSIY